MLNRSLLQRITYRQRDTDNFCILGSFGVAASAFTNHTDIREYFSQHCAAFSDLDPLIRQRGWYLNPNHDPENSYLSYMVMYYDVIRKINWYRAMEDLYNTRKYALFETASKNFTIEMIDDAATQASIIEKRLQDTESNLVNICLNWPPRSDGSNGGVHSITVGWDVDGFYTYDVNDGQVVAFPPNMGLIAYANQRGGSLGNGMFFKQKTENPAP